MLLILIEKYYFRYIIYFYNNGLFKDKLNKSSSTHMMMNICDLTVHNFTTSDPDDFGPLRIRGNYSTHVNKITQVYEYSGLRCNEYVICV